MGKWPKYSPEGYPAGNKLLAKQAQKRLDEQAPEAERGARVLKELAAALGSRDPNDDRGPVRSKRKAVTLTSEAVEQIRAHVEYARDAFRWYVEHCGFNCTQAIGACEAALALLPKKEEP